MSGRAVRMARVAVLGRGRPALRRAVPRHRAEREARGRYQGNERARELSEHRDNLARGGMPCNPARTWRGTPGGWAGRRYPRSRGSCMARPSSRSGCLAARTRASNSTSECDGAHVARRAGRVSWGDQRGYIVIMARSPLVRRLLAVTPLLAVLRCGGGDLTLPSGGGGGGGSGPSAARSTVT